MQQHLTAHAFSSAWRQIVRHPGFAMITVSGMAIGLAACLLLLIFVRSELNWDRYWGQGENLYIATMNMQTPGRAPRRSAWADAPVFQGALASLEGEAEAIARSTFHTKILGEAHAGTRLSFALGSEQLLRALQPKMVHGSWDSTLQDPSDVYLAKSEAIKLFGKDNALGESFSTDDGRGFVVRGVFEDIPEQSHIGFGAIAKLLPSDLGPDGVHIIDQGGYIMYYVYARLKEGAPVSLLDETLAERVKQLSQDVDNPIASKPTTLVNVRATHLEPGLSGWNDAVDAGNLVLFSAIAVIILVIASINFMNMTVVRMTARLKEVALRKILGASGIALFKHFISETSLSVSLAFVLALAIAEFTMPALSSWLGLNLELNSILDPAFIIFAGLLLAATILMAGLYPAILAARLRPAESLSAGRALPLIAMRISQFMLVLQFAAAISLISATVIVNSQLNHMNTLDRGFERKSIITAGRVDHPDAQAIQGTLKNRMLAEPGIMAASYSWTTPGVSGRSIFTTNVVNGEEVDPIAFTGRYVDPDYFDTLGIKLVSGRGFDPQSADDIRVPDLTREIDEQTLNGRAIISVLGARQMGFASPEAALNSTVVVGDGTVLIIGVVDDIFVDAKEIGREPTVYLYEPVSYATLNIRFAGDPATAMARLEKVWQEMLPNLPWRGRFLDDVIKRRYQQQQMQGDLFTLFAGLAVVIALMGLFGISAFHARRRQKEVSLRRIHGARIADILALMSWHFTRPVLIASAISWPLIYVWSSDWLLGFSERISHSLPLFVGPSLLTLALAIGTITGHALSAARKRPSTILRAEG